MKRKTYAIKVRMTQEDHEMLEQIKEERSYDSISETIRELIRLASHPRLQLPENYIADLQVIAKNHNLDSPSEAMAYLIYKHMGAPPSGDKSEKRREFYRHELGLQAYMAGMRQLAEQGSGHAQTLIETVEAKRATREARAQQWVEENPDKWQLLLDESKEIYPDEWQLMLEGWLGENLEEEHNER